jgi:protein-L-isoaspartate(D-aspartate) O-methyltransferase
MRISLPLAFAVAAVAGEAPAENAQCVRERAAMVETIRDHLRADVRLLGPQGFSQRVLDAMGQTPRHRFAPGNSCSIGYADRAVSIGLGQTISQPFVVALMTQLASVSPEDTVLEVGTGSGYQAAVLARLAKTVCTIEIVPSLAVTAAKLLRQLGHDNVTVRAGDGYRGWPDCGPFDAIVVTAALGHVPPPLIEQLKVGGRLVMPVGPVGGTQRLTLVEKIAPGQTTTRAVTLVRFVPFTGPGQ